MMAVDLHLRNQLLPESPVLTEEERSSIKPMTKSYSSCFTSSDFGSAFSSPVDSEQGSTESESDQDDDYIAELTRKMAQYMLQEDDSNKQNEEAEWPKLGSNGKKNEQKGDGLLPKPITAPVLDFRSKQALIDEQIRNIQLHKLKQEQYMKQQQHIESNRQSYQNKGRGLNGFRNGSEMTAVFLGESGSKNGSCGTGVFLPRPITNPSNSRKKTGCSTVIVPARVVEALKLQIDRLGIKPRFNAANFPIQNDGTYEQQQIGEKSQTQMEPALTNEEIDLPKEWTY